MRQQWHVLNSGEYFEVVGGGSAIEWMFVFCHNHATEQAGATSGLQRCRTDAGTAVYCSYGEIWITSCATWTLEFEWTPHEVNDSLAPDRHLLFGCRSPGFLIWERPFPLCFKLLHWKNQDNNSIAAFSNDVQSCSENPLSRRINYYRGVIGVRTGRISAKLGERGALKAALPGTILFASPYLFPTFSTHEV